MKLLTEIPINGISMRDAVEMMGKLNTAGYNANLTSKQGRVIIQLQKQNN